MTVREANIKAILDIADKIDEIRAIETARQEAVNGQVLAEGDEEFIKIIATINIYVATIYAEAAKVKTLVQAQELAVAAEAEAAEFAEWRAAKKQLIQPE